jgi:hypothetical protein
VTRIRPSGRNAIPQGEARDEVNVVVFRTGCESASPGVKRYSIAATAKAAGARAGEGKGGMGRAFLTGWRNRRPTLRRKCGFQSIPNIR